MQATKPNPEPESVPAHEKINVAVAVPGERAGAEKNNDADGEQPEDSEKQNVGALPVHQERLRASCSDFVLRLLLWPARCEFLSDLKFARIVDLIQLEQIVVRDLEAVRAIVTGLSPFTTA